MKKLFLFLFAVYLFANTMQEAIQAFEKKDYQKSFKLFSKINSPKAYYYIARHYYHGYGVKKDINKAIKYAIMACNGNYVKACNALGWLYKYSGIVKKDIDLALSYYKRGCELKYAKSCNEAGIIFHHRKNYKLAVKYYKKACDLNENWGCDNLAWHYKYGKGIEKNIIKALNYYKKGCKLKNGTSCNEAGRIYTNYYHDCKNAIIFYKKAKDLNNSWGYSNLSSYYIFGKCVKKDLNKGFELAKKAAELNNSFGFNNMGIVYERKNKYKLAIKYYKIACDMNNSYGCSNLAWYYKNEKNSLENELKAFKYYNKACKLDGINNSKSCDLSLELFDKFSKFNINKIKKLIHKGFNINTYNCAGDTLLSKAIEYGKTDVVNFLISQGANINDTYSGQTLLHLAIKKGNIKIFKILINNGIDIHKKNFRGMTPLAYASFIGEPKMVKILIEHRAKVNIVNNDDFLYPKGMTPLLYAASQSNPKVVKILLDNGANIYSKNADGKTAIDYVTREYNYQDYDAEIVKLLILHGVNPNLILSDGKTILMHMIYSPDTVKFLIKHGANVNLKTKNGITALKLAKQYGYKDAVKILIENGAK
jgi:TPR repeat protein